MSNSSCYSPSRVPNKSCKLALPYKPCEDCHYSDGYPLNSCVSICQDINGISIEVFYTSLEANNKTHPITGNWRATTICDLIQKANEEVDLCSLVTAMADNNNTIGG